MYDEDHHIYDWYVQNIFAHPFKLTRADFNRVQTGEHNLIVLFTDGDATQQS